ncbi:MAG: hypothetical protein ACOY4D_10880 [Pseudomonadota bacterium]
MSSVYNLVNQVKVMELNQMGRKGAPRGNRNAKKGALFRDALHKALVRDKGSLERIASALVARAEEGDLTAIKEIADRLDGKPVQAIAGAGEDDTPVVVTLRIMDHNGVEQL